MPIALLHPGDLGCLGALLLLLFMIGAPALVLAALGYAFYKGLSVKKETFTTINPEGDIEPDIERRGRAGRP